MYSLSSRSRGRALLPRLRALLTLQRSEHAAANEGNHGELCTQKGSAWLFEEDHKKLHKWKKVDSRTLGITPSMISHASWTVVKILRKEGYEAYLVGGCVRDLILKRIPKDFDVITNATLAKIQTQFNRAIIIGQRFPICKVFIGGSSVEVSSFDTAPKINGQMNETLSSIMPAGCDEKDRRRWTDCMYRDFTINSLFYDPFDHKIYDYYNSLMDLKLSKLRTLRPAHLSFEEDCARILRGLRLAARLKLSFVEETETAIRDLSSSISRLTTGRLFMEVNYMLSYGAAERSFCMLRRYHLLEILFPIHDAYLTEQSNLKSTHDSMMLMNMFSNLDLLVSCERPSDSTLWLAILAFHTALIRDPQHAIVVLAFASLLYHGNWDEGITYARGHIDKALKYDTEILDSGCYLSDDELAERIAKLTTLIKDSIDVLTYSNSLQNAMAKFPDSTCSGLVFVSKRMGERVEQVFDTLVKGGVSIVSLNRKRKNFKIDYGSLGKGDICETSFVLGKIIIDAMIPAGCLGKEQISKEQKSTGDQHRNVVGNLYDILTQSIRQSEKDQSEKDEFQAMLGHVIHESTNDDGSKRVELNHEKRFQLLKHSKKLDKRNDLLVRKKATSIEEHHFLEEESVEENEIAVGRDQPNPVDKRLASKRNAEDNLKKAKIEKSLSKVGGNKNKELNPFRKHLKMSKKGHDVLVEKQRSMQVDHFPGAKGVEENETVVDRDEPNLDRIGLTSERNAAHNLKNVESKKVQNVLRSNKEELIHYQRVQRPVKKYSETLDNCLDMLNRKMGTSMQEHHFTEKELVEGNKTVVERDEPNLDRRGQTLEGKTEYNLENDNKSKKAAARLSDLF